MCCIEIQNAFKAEVKCFSKTTSATENRRQFLIEVPKSSSETFCRIDIDGCLITSEKVEKCDFAFQRCSNSDYYFVELKGKKIKKGFSQILATIEQFKAKIKIEKISIYGFIVASEVKSPKNNATEANLKKTFAKHHGVALHIKSGKLIFKP